MFNCVWIKLYKNLGTNLIHLIKTIKIRKACYAGVILCICVIKYDDLWKHMHKIFPSPKKRGYFSCVRKSAEVVPRFLCFWHVFNSKCSLGYEESMFQTICKTLIGSTYSEGLQKTEQDKTPNCEWQVVILFGSPETGHGCMHWIYLHQYWNSENLIGLQLTEGNWCIYDLLTVFK